MECYAFNEECLRKFSLIALGEHKAILLNTISILKSILKKLFLIRLTNELLGWGMKIIDFTKYIKITGTRFSFDEEKFISAYLQKNKRWKQKDTFEKTMKVNENKYSFEDNRSIRGHDACQLLLHLNNKFIPKRKFGNAETIGGALFASLEFEDLKKYYLFQRIMEI